MPERSQSLLQRAHAGAAHAGRRAPGDRRAEPGRRPWLLVRGGALGAGRFTAVHQITGRAIRLDAGSVAQAEVQVELLNRRTLEITV